MLFIITKKIYKNIKHRNLIMPLTIIESNEGSNALIPNLHLFARIYTKLTGHVLIKNKNKHIKCVSSCVTEGLDRNTSYFKRQAGKHATLCQPKTETSDDLSLYRRYVNINIIFVFI
jgi:hypothetical protein